MTKYNRTKPKINSNKGKPNDEQFVMMHNLKKKLGQHLLNAPSILHKIVVASDIKPHDIVLEIGPGTGNLTVKLLPLARKVIVVDVDEGMISELRKRISREGYSNIEYRCKDALKDDFGQFDVCTANLPYQISSPFVFKLIAHRPLFRTAVLMFQKEFAQRLIAKPGDKMYCRLSVNTQLFCKVDCVCAVKSAHFKPPPKVDSMVVKLTPLKPSPKFDFHEWDQLLRICFIRKRKTLASIFSIKSVLSSIHNNYTALCKSKEMTSNVVNIKELILKILNDLNMATSRAVNLSVENFFELLYKFHENSIYFHNVIMDNLNYEHDY